jgi:hypothetical protein
LGVYGVYKHFLKFNRKLYKIHYINKNIYKIYYITKKHTKNGYFIQIINIYLLFKIIYNKLKTTLSSSRLYFFLSNPKKTNK